MRLLKNNKLSKYMMLICMICGIMQHTQSQNWTEPVNVSNMNDFIIYSDFTIDNEGVIHCVWNLKYNNNHGVIFYASSEDDGATWTEPIGISQNDTYYCSNPQIVHDSENNLFVGYDLNIYTQPNWGSYTYVVIKDDSGWGTPMEFSEGISTRLVVDNNDRVYVFWYTGSPYDGQFSYQYLEGGSWSEIFCPYDNDEKTGLVEVVVDNDNNLHCVGTHRFQVIDDPTVIYYTYNYQTDTWGELLFPESHDWTRDAAISVDNENTPHLCWIEGGTATSLVYTFYDGNSWSEKETVGSGRNYSVIMEIDSTNKIHIAATDLKNETMELDYFHRPNGINWEELMVDQADNVIFTPEFEIYNEQLYLVYKRSDDPSYSDVFLTKLDLLISTKDIHNLTTSMSILQSNPNPFNHYTRINFKVRQAGNTQIELRDMKGVVIKKLVKGWHDKGVYSVKWDGTDERGIKQKPGVYFCNLLTSTGQQTTIRILYTP